MLTELQKKQLIQEYVRAIWNQELVHKLGDFLEPNCKVRCTKWNHEQIGSGYSLREIFRLKNIAADLQFQIDKQEASDQTVISEWTANGTACHSHSLNGFQRTLARFKGKLLAIFSGDKISEMEIRVEDNILGAGKNEQRMAPFAQDDKMFLDVRQAGSASGRPVVFVSSDLLPGWQVWAKLGSDILPFRPCIHHNMIIGRLAIEKDAFPPDYNLGDEVEALKKQFVALGITEPCDFVGWSMGGTIALEMAIRYPDLVNSLVLIEPVSYSLIDRNGLEEDFRRELERRLSPNTFPMDKEVTREMLAQLMVDTKAYPSLEFVRTFENFNFLVPYRSVLKLRFRNWDFPIDIDRFSKLRLPVLVIQGNKSLSFCRKVNEVIMKHATNPIYLELNGAHRCHIDDYDTFLPAFKNFLGITEAMRKLA